MSLFISFVAELKNDTLDTKSGGFHFTLDGDLKVRMLIPLNSPHQPIQAALKNSLLGTKDEAFWKKQTLADDESPVSKEFVKKAVEFYSRYAQFDLVSSSALEKGNRFRLLLNGNNKETVVFRGVITELASVEIVSL